MSLTTIPSQPSNIPSLFDGLISKTDAIAQMPGGERAFDRFVVKSKLRRIVIMRHVYFNVEELKAAIHSQGREMCPEPRRGRPTKRAA